MKTDLHPLQQASPKLLTSLYADKRLPLTSAMVAVGNGYYPSVQQILNTLNQYSDVDIVVAFCRENMSAVEEAKNAVAKAKVESKLAGNETNHMNGIESIGFPNTQARDFLLERPIKSVSTEQIESTFSKALLELTGQKYKVDLTQLNLNPEPNSWLRDAALINFRIEKDVI